MLFFLLLVDARNADEGIGTCGWILVGLSYVMFALTFPFSLCVSVKVNENVLLKLIIICIV